MARLEFRNLLANGGVSARRFRDDPVLEFIEKKTGFLNYDELKQPRKCLRRNGLSDS